MFFIVLTFCAALFIEGLGSLVSVIGISALFGANPIIIALAIALDLGKVVTVSLLYTYWKSLSKLMKGYALLAACVTMIITSAGAAGYLSGEFQKAIMGTKEGELKVSVLKEQQAKYQARKTQIDDQIAALPTKTTVNQRLRLMNGFKAEQKALDEKISKIDQDLPTLQVKQIGTEAKAGPILAIAKSFNISVEEAVKWVIGMIIFVFDPLAIFLIISGNFLWARHKAMQVPVKTVAYTIEAEVPPPVAPIVEEPVEAPAPPTKPEPQPEPVVEEVAEPVIVPEETSYEKYEPIPAEPVVIPEPKQVPELSERRSTSRARHIPTGLLSPIEVKPEEAVEEILDTTNIEPFTIPEPVIPEPAVPEEDTIGVGPVLDDEVAPREEITMSSLGLVAPDPHTIVDAHRNLGFRKTTMTTPPK